VNFGLSFKDAEDKYDCCCLAGKGSSVTPQRPRLTAHLQRSVVVILDLVNPSVVRTTGTAMPLAAWW